MELALAIAGALLTLIVPFVVEAYKRQGPKRERLLKYDASAAALLAMARPEALGYRIEILFHGPNGTETVRNVVASFIRFANFGTEPIRRGDLVAADPLRITVEAERVLDITVAKTTRAICNVTIGQMTSNDGLTESTLAFDFLDHLDGAAVQILSSGPIKAKLQGSVIGMPKGLILAKKSKPQPALKWAYSNAFWLGPLLAAFWIIGALTSKWGAHINLLPWIFGVGIIISISSQVLALYLTFREAEPTREMKHLSSLSEKLPDTVRL